MWILYTSHLQPTLRARNLKPRSQSSCNCGRRLAYSRVRVPVIILLFYTLFTSKLCSPTALQLAVERLTPRASVHVEGGALTVAAVVIGLSSGC